MRVKIIYFIASVPRQDTKLENRNVFVSKYSIFTFYPLYVLNHKFDFEFFTFFFKKLPSNALFKMGKNNLRGKKIILVLCDTFPKCILGPTRTKFSSYINRI